MARSYRYDPDAPENEERRQQDRHKRDARKAAHFTPAPVTQALRVTHDDRTTRDE